MVGVFYKFTAWNQPNSAQYTAALGISLHGLYEEFINHWKIYEAPDSVDSQIKKNCDFFPTNRSEDRYLKVNTDH